MIHKIVVILLANHLDHVVFRSIHDQDSKGVGFCSKAPVAKFVPSRTADDDSGNTGMNGLVVVLHRQVECQIGPRRMPGQDPFLDFPGRWNLAQSLECDFVGQAEVGDKPHWF